MKALDFFKEDEEVARTSHHSVFPRIMVHNTLIELSEQLLALVKAAEANKDPNSKAAWDAKHRIALLCNDLKREALGPAEFTAVVAGAFDI